MTAKLVAFSCSTTELGREGLGAAFNGNLPPARACRSRGPSAWSRGARGWSQQPLPGLVLGEGWAGVGPEAPRPGISCLPCDSVVELGPRSQPVQLLVGRRS